MSEGIKIQRDKIKELEHRIAELEKRPRIIDLSSCESRIRELEGWNAEMYENHRIELARLQSIIDQGKYQKDLDQTYIAKLKAQLTAVYKNEESEEARIRWRDRYSSLFNSPHISSSSAQYNIFAEWYQEINDEYKSDD